VAEAKLKLPHLTFTDPKNSIIMKNILFTLHFLLFTVAVVRASDGSTGIPAKSLNNNSSAYVYKNYGNGFFNHTEIDLAFGLGSTELPYSQRFFGATTLGGYHFNSVIFTGIGAGIFDYNSGVMAPVFIHARYNFTSKRVSPFLCSDLGMLFNLSGTDINNPFYANPGAGISVLTQRKRTFTATVSLYTHWKKDVVRESFINLKIGLLLK
jgi:hypothetical protein